MSDVKFPLCSALGLAVRTDVFNWKFDDKVEVTEFSYIKASDVESLLSRGVRLRSFGDANEWYATHHHKYELCNTQSIGHGVQGLIIDIKPIAKPERRRELSESEVRKQLSEWLENEYEKTIDCAIERLFDTNKEGGR